MTISKNNNLNNNAWLQTLPAKARQKLIDVIKIKNYPAQQMVHRKNSPADGLYGVISGEVNISATTMTGEEIIFTRINSGQWYGEIALLDGGSKTHDGFTTVESQLAIIPKSDILRLSRQHMEIHNALVLLLCQHCRQAFKAIDDFLLFTPEQRMAKLLLNQFNPNESIFINQKDLGKLVGISRQSTNKILRSWEENGLIKRIYGGLDILKITKMKSLAIK